MKPRFYIEHGVIHDRNTGKHVVTDGQPPFEDSIEQVCELLNGLAHVCECEYPVPDKDGVSWISADCPIHGSRAVSDSSPNKE